MKKSIFALALISLGMMAGFISHGLLSINGLHADPLNHESQKGNAPFTHLFGEYIFTGNTSGITRRTAYEFFQDYHDSSTPAGSKGCLKTEVKGHEEAIIAFFLSDSLLISPLRAMIEDTLGLNFAGLAGIPGFNENTNSHTMIWVAVSEETASNGKKEYNYVLPSDSDPGNTSLIMDYIDVCPIYCPKNKDRLWKQDWKE